MVSNMSAEIVRNRVLIRHCEDYLRIFHPRWEQDNKLPHSKLLLDLYSGLLLGIDNTLKTHNTAVVEGGVGGTCSMAKNMSEKSKINDKAG
jgi:hypothetical protein